MSNLNSAQEKNETMNFYEGKWKLADHAELPLQDQISRVLFLNKVLRTFMPEGRDSVVTLLTGQAEGEVVLFDSKAKSVDVALTSNGKSSSEDRLEFRVKQENGEIENIPFEFSGIEIDTWTSADFKDSVVVDFVGKQTLPSGRVERPVLRVMTF